MNVFDSPPASCLAIWSPPVFMQSRVPPAGLVVHFYHWPFPSFRKAWTTGTLASQAEIGVWVTSTGVACTPRTAFGAGIRCGRGHRTTADGCLLASQSVLMTNFSVVAVFLRDLPGIFQSTLVRHFPVLWYRSPECLCRTVDRPTANIIPSWWINVLYRGPALNLYVFGK